MRRWGFGEHVPTHRRFDCRALPHQRRQSHQRSGAGRGRPHGRMSLHRLRRCRMVLCAAPAKGWTCRPLPGAHLEHRLGDEVLTWGAIGRPIRLFGRTFASRSPARHFYMFRNGCWLVLHGAVPLRWKLLEAMTPFPDLSPIWMHAWWAVLVANALGIVIDDPASHILSRQHRNNAIGMPHGLTGLLRRDWRSIRRPPSATRVSPGMLLAAIYGPELRLRNTLHHQSLLVLKSVHPQPPFDPRYRIYGDWDFNIRLWQRRAEGGVLRSRCCGGRSERHQRGAALGETFASPGETPASALAMRVLGLAAGSRLRAQRRNLRHLADRIGIPA